MTPRSFLFASAVTTVGFCLSSFVHAEPRSSATFKIAHEVVDGGGGRSASTNFENNGSIGGAVVGLAAAGPFLAKNGFTGQLYDVRNLQVTDAASRQIAEGGTLQLHVAQVMDDDTVLPADPADVTWQTTSGSEILVDGTGLATAPLVYENTLSTLRATLEARFAFTQLKILDTIPDNFGSYAGDGIDDDWQFQYFGLNNPLAGPMQNPDFDPHDNLFEFTAGLIPTDSNSVFRLDPVPVPNQPGQMNLVISPRLPDRTYTVKWSPTLGGGAMWNDLTSFSVLDDGLTRTITDLDATGTAKFYQIEITKP